MIIRHGRVRVNLDEKSAQIAVMRRFDGAWCHAQLHRASQLRNDGCGLLVPGGNFPTAPISQGEVMQNFLLKWMVHSSSPFSQNFPARSVPILLPWKQPSIYKQVKWPLDLPLMPLVIVSPNDTLSQQKLKLIPASDLEDDDSRPEWSRQHPGDQPPVR